MTKVIIPVEALIGFLRTINSKPQSDRLARLETLKLVIDHALISGDHDEALAFIEAITDSASSVVMLGIKHVVQQQKYEFRKECNDCTPAEMRRLRNDSF